MKKMKLDPRNRRQMIKLHRELWNWLYENPSKVSKLAWPRWVGQGGDIPMVNCECFACHHSDSLDEPCDNKRGCPLFRWGTSDHTCIFVNSYYDKWTDAGTDKTRKKYAKLIRDLPVRRARR
jgi:hypothetical protein